MGWVNPCEANHFLYFPFCPGPPVWKSIFVCSGNFLYASIALVTSISYPVNKTLFGNFFSIILLAVPSFMLTFDSSTNFFAVVLRGSLPVSFSFKKSVNASDDPPVRETWIAFPLLFVKTSGKSFLSL